MLNIDYLPNKPGVYIFKSKNDKNLYIGKAKDIKKRISQYFMKNSLWKQEMLSKATNVEYFEVNNEEEALLLENNLIKKHQPPYNSLLKGDNTYTYLKISHETYPQIYFTRYKDTDNGTYLGPKTHQLELKKILQSLRYFLQYRTCLHSKFKKGELCNDYFFGSCAGWCIYNYLENIKNKEKLKNFQEYLNKIGFQLNKDINAQKEKSQTIINLLINFFKGDYQEIENLLKNKINELIIDQNYEYAAKLRDVYYNLQLFQDKQNVDLAFELTGYFYLILQINQKIILIILNFYKSKLIDIIRTHFNINEYIINDIVQNLQNEFQIKFSEKEINSKKYYGYSENIQIKSENISAILNLADKFLESYLISTHNNQENLLINLLDGLQQKYNFKNIPINIECIDISHMGGNWVVGGLSAMQDGILNKKSYRRYKINLTDQKGHSNNDYLSLKEILIRRLKSTNNKLPDLLIIDGGKGQLAIIKQLINNKKYQQLSNIEIISIGKGESRKRGKKLAGIKEKIFKFNLNGEIVEIEMVYDQYDQILLKIRDEAHRFANNYRKKLMSQEILL